MGSFMYKSVHIALFSGIFRCSAPITHTPSGERASERLGIRAKILNVFFGLVGLEGIFWLSR